MAVSFIGGGKQSILRKTSDLPNSHSALSLMYEGSTVLESVLS